LGKKNKSKINTNSFEVILFKDKIVSPLNEGVNEGVNNLYKFILQHQGNRAPFYAEKLSIPLKTIERWIKILKKEKKIEFKGSSKIGGYWQIINNNNDN